MPQLTTSIQIDSPPARVFSIIRDVACYAEHFRYVQSVSILSTTEDHVIAEISEEVHGFRQKAIARFQFNAPHRIDVEQIQGPFRTASARFSLAPDGEGTQFRHTIEFELKRGLTNNLIGRMVTDSVVKARMSEEDAAIKQVAEKGSSHQTH